MRLQVSVPRWWPQFGMGRKVFSRICVSTGKTTTAQRLIWTSWISYWRHRGNLCFFDSRGVLKSPSTVRKEMCWGLSDMNKITIEVWHQWHDHQGCDGVFFVHLVRFKDPITDKGKARTHRNADETQMMQTCHENTKMRTTAASLTASSHLKIGRNPKGSRIVFQLPTIILAEILHHLGCFSCRVNSRMFATNLNWWVCRKLPMNLTLEASKKGRLTLQLASETRLVEISGFSDGFLIRQVKYL